MRKDLSKPQPKKQPTVEEVAAFVSGGAGHDTARQKNQSTGSGDSVKQEMTRLTVYLPRETHHRFKVACTITRRKMNDEIRRFIERRSAELEGSGGTV